MGSGLEADHRARAGRLADDLEVARLDAAGELHVVDLAVAVDLDLEPLADEVDDARADAVQAARRLVGAVLVVLELAARAERGEDDLDGRDLRLGVHADGDAPAVVAARAASVGLDLHVDVVRVAGERLVDRVVDDLVDEVVQAARVVAADVHAGAEADVLDVGQHLDLRLAVLAGDLAAEPLSGSDGGGVDLGRDRRDAGRHERRVGLRIGRRQRFGHSRSWKSRPTRAASRRDAVGRKYRRNRAKPPRSPPQATGVSCDLRTPTASHPWACIDVRAIVASARSLRPLARVYHRPRCSD